MDDDLELLLYGDDERQPFDQELSGYESVLDDSFFVSEAQERATEEGRLATIHKARYDVGSSNETQCNDSYPESRVELGGHADGSASMEYLAGETGISMVDTQKSYEALRMFKELLDDGVITQEEFDTVKAKALGIAIGMRGDDGEAPTEVVPQSPKDVDKDSAKVVDDKDAVLHVFVEWDDSRPDFQIARIHDPSHLVDTRYPTEFYMPKDMGIVQFCDQISHIISHDLDKRVVWSLPEGKCGNETLGDRGKRRWEWIAIALLFAATIAVIIAALSGVKHGVPSGTSEGYGGKSSDVPITRRLSDNNSDGGFVSTTRGVRGRAG